MRHFTRCTILTLALVFTGGAARADQLVCWASPATIEGTAGDDALFGTPGVDVIHAGGGNDRVWGLEEDDVICGGEGSDVIFGGEGNDVLLGEAQDDKLFGAGPRHPDETGVDHLLGGAGDDHLDGGPGDLDSAQWVFSAAGITATLAGGWATGEGSDTLVGVEHLVGSDSNDILRGDGGANILTPLFGDDLVDGGGGFDVVNFGFDQVSVIVDLAAGSSTGQGTDSLILIEGVEGSGVSDILIGDGNANWLSGSGGADLIEGRGHDDELVGGSGGDMLAGGEGDDVITGGADVDVGHGGPDNDTCDTEVKIECAP